MINKVLNFFISLLLAGLLQAGFAAPKIEGKVLQVEGLNTVYVQTAEGKKIVRLMGTRFLPANEVRTRLRFFRAPLSEKKAILATSSQARIFLGRMLKRNDKVTIEEAEGFRDELNLRRFYVYLEDGTMLNLAAIRQGYSNLMTKRFIKKAYRKKFEIALKLAIKKKDGLYRLWQQENKLANRRKKVKLKYAGQRKVTFMTLNTENLFDTKKDPKTRDYTFIPIKYKRYKTHIKYCSRRKWGRKECLNLDWNDKLLNLKMKRLADTVFQLNNGKGPDILFLQEVENYKVLRKWRDEYLKKGKYSIVHIDSNDPRGIDTAILSRFKLAEIPTFHKITLKEGFDTRGILKASFYLPNRDIVSCFAIHFPAQFAPRSTRIQALQVLGRLKRGLPEGYLAVASGDSNISKIEDVKYKLFDKYAKKDFEVSHHVGCKKCKGTSYYEYKKSWSFFDVFLFSREMRHDGDSPWKVRYKSIRMPIDAPHQVTEEGTPLRFKYPKFAGVSDHFPLAMDVYLKGSASDGKAKSSKKKKKKKKKRKKKKR